MNLKDHDFSIDRLDFRHMFRPTNLCVVLFGQLFFKFLFIVHASTYIFLSVFIFPSAFYCILIVLLQVGTYICV